MSNLILPRYLLQKRTFECPRCGFRYWRETPSKVDRCPMCEKEGLTIKIYAEGSGGKVQDSYSRWKERIYDDPLGRAHEEDIKMRHIENKEGGNKMVMWKDKKGRVIDIAADNPYPDNPKAKRYNTK